MRRSVAGWERRVGLGYDVNRWLGLALGYRYIHVSGDQDVFGAGFARKVDGFNHHFFEMSTALRF